MHARAHLRLVPTRPPQADDAQASPRERVSLVQPIGRWRSRQSWLRRHAALVALWCASFALLSLAGVLLALR